MGQFEGRYPDSFRSREWIAKRKSYHHVSVHEDKICEGRQGSASKKRQAEKKHVSYRRSYRTWTGQEIEAIEVVAKDGHNRNCCIKWDRAKKAYPVLSRIQTLCLSLKPSTCVSL